MRHCFEQRLLLDGSSAWLKQSRCGRCSGEDLAKLSGASEGYYTFIYESIHEVPRPVWFAVASGRCLGS